MPEDTAKSSKAVEEIFQRASTGSRVSLQECDFLKSHLDPERKFPMHCSMMLQAAAKRGLLTRRDSRVQQTWKRGEHGVNRLSAGEVPDSMDSVLNPALAESANDIYMSSKTPEQQEKIRRLHVRAASQGARPRVDYQHWTADPENQHQVVKEVRKELVRRASRRDELKSKAAMA